MAVVESFWVRWPRIDAEMIVWAMDRHAAVRFEHEDEPIRLFRIEEMVLVEPVGVMAREDAEEFIRALEGRLSCLESHWALKA